MLLLLLLLHPPLHSFTRSFFCCRNCVTENQSESIDWQAILPSHVAALIQEEGHKFNTWIQDVKGAQVSEREREPLVSPSFREASASIIEPCLPPSLSPLSLTQSLIVGQVFPDVIA